MCSPDPIHAKKSGWSQAAIQHHQLGCYLEAAWSSRYLVVHDRWSMENGRGLARCIQLPTQRDTDWTETWAQSEFYYVLIWLHFEASHLELWGWGGGEEGAALNKGREVGEDKEEEEETGRGEELLNPSEKAWTLSGKQTGQTQMILQYLFKYFTGFLRPITRLPEAWARWGR